MSDSSKQWTTFLAEGQKQPFKSAARTTQRLSGAQVNIEETRKTTLSIARAVSAGMNGSDRPRSFTTTVWQWKSTGNDVMKRSRWGGYA
ncbi:hypothetical protein Alg215_06417 [Pyrenophora tritici-repentis]|nr:hypothetical protein Alg215_06417 [Pyrenophora tritici-repentis]